MDEDTIIQDLKDLKNLSEINIDLGGVFEKKSVSKPKQIF
jgi:hypothetical protein